MSARSGLLGIDEALARIDAASSALPAQELPLARALHRVLAAPACAACDLPPFAQSAMDGYAVSTADLSALPARLPLAGVIAAAAQPALAPLAPGSARRIYTGAMVPPGADAVVQQEWTTTDGASVQVLRAVTPGLNVRGQGEELRAGTALAGAGVRLNPGLLAALSAAGIATVSVHALPRVVVLITGDEIVPPGQPLAPGEVYDANGPLLSAWFAALGFPPPQLLRVADHEDAVSATLREAFASADLVLSTGGVSVGDKDLIAPVAERLGAQRLLWKVAQKPGKPLYVARHGGSLLLGLPGNPASVLVNLCVYVRRVLDRMQGLATPGPLWRMGRTTAPLRPDPLRDSWLRMRSSVDAQGGLRLSPLGGQASHMLSNLADADVLVRLPSGDGVQPAGTLLRWQPLFS